MGSNERSDLLASALRGSRPPAPGWLWSAAGVASVVAALLTFMGVVIAATVVSSNEDFRAVLGLIGYLAAGVVLPAAVFWRSSRNKERSLVHALLPAAGVSLLVHLVLAPIAIAVLGGA